MAWHQFAGMPRKSYLPEHVAYRAMIVDPANAYQRPGYSLWGGSGSKSINHETDNYNVGAEALMHGQYLINGPRDRFGNRMYVSWHFCVDGGSTAKGHGPMVSQSIPCDEVSWQGACGACGGNYDCVSVEQAVNADGDRAKARDAHEWLTASIHETLGIGAEPESITLHWDWNAGTLDRHHCPDNMLTDGYVPTFKANVKAKHAQIVQLRIQAEGAPVAEVPKPTYPAADLPNWFTTLEASEHPTDRNYSGRTAYRCQRNYRNVSSTATTRYTKPYAKGETRSAASGPKVEPDEKLFGIYLWVHPDDGRTWILEETGHWLLASKFTPRVRIDPRTAE